jgi:hypothetical protein
MTYLEVDDYDEFLYMVFYCLFFVRGKFKFSLLLPTHSTLYQINCYFLSINKIQLYEGRLRSLWTHVITPSRKFVEVR